MKKYDLEEIIGEKALSPKFDEYTVKYWSYSRSISELYEMYRNNEIIIPYLQREYVWTEEQAGLFIDSILRGLPTPSLFLTEMSNKFLIIDGLQRIHTLFLFISGKKFENWVSSSSAFKLKSNNQICNNWQGLSFEDLEEKYKLRIKRTMLNIIEFTQIDPSKNYSAMYQIFERINSTGRILKPQEIRNAAYHSEFNKKLNEISSNEDFGFIFPAKSDIDKAEWILRYLAIRHYYKSNYIRGSKKSLLLTDLLNEYMALYQSNEFNNEITEKIFPNFYDLNTEDMLNEFDLFQKVCQIINLKLGGNAFKNIDIDNFLPDKKYKNRIHPTIFDSIMVATSIVYEENLKIFDKLTNDNWRNNIDDFLFNNDTQERLSKKTMNQENILWRINAMIDVIKNG